MKLSRAVLGAGIVWASLGWTCSFGYDIATETTQQVNRSLLQDIDSLTSKIELLDEQRNKIIQAKSDIAFAMDQLQALKDRGQLLSKNSSGQVTTSSLNGFSLSPSGGLTGSNAGYVGNLISPMDGLPISTQSLLPTQISAIAPASLSGVLQKANSFLSSGNSSLFSLASNALGSSATGQQVLPFVQQAISGLSNSGGGSSAAPDSTDAGSGTTTTPALSGAMLLGDGLVVRPAAGTNGSTDGMFAQIMGSGTPAQKLTFLGSTYYASGPTVYDPMLGYVNSSQFVPNSYVNMNDVLTAGAYSAMQTITSQNGGGTNPYANFSVNVSPTVAATVLQNTPPGTPLVVTSSTVSAAQQGGVSGVIVLNPQDYYLFNSTSGASTSLHRISPGSFVAGEASPGDTVSSPFQDAAYRPNLALFLLAQTSGGSQAVIAAGPTASQAQGYSTSLAASNERLSEISQQMAAVQQQIQITQTLLQNAQQLGQTAQAIAQQVNQAQENSVAELATFTKTCQDSASDYQKDIFDMNGMTERLEQRRFNELVRRDEMVKQTRNEVQASENARLTSLLLSR